MDFHSNVVIIISELYSIIHKLSARTDTGGTPARIESGVTPPRLDVICLLKFYTQDVLPAEGKLSPDSRRK